MKKEAWFLFLALLLFLMPLMSGISSSVDSEIQKITHYAEQYETGNINYAQLLIYLGSGRQKLNSILGAIGMEHGGTFKQEQLKSFLGEPTGETRWMWFEKEQREKRIDASAPTWEKIIFDGNKIQIKLNAFPFLSGENEEAVYDLNFQSNFKKSQEEMDISGKIEEIKGLAEIFNADPSVDNARTLAKESVNAEKSFESYFRQSGKKCEDTMKSIFGTENIRETQQMLVNEISFYVGENFEVKARLEMCDNCEWNWINLDFWIEGRGPGFKESKGEQGTFNPEQFKSMNSEQFETAITDLINNIKSLINEGKYSEALSKKSELSALNEAWNQKSNDVWQQVEGVFKEEKRSMAPQVENSVCVNDVCEAKAVQSTQQMESNFDWKAFDNKRKEKEKELRKANYEERKQFFLDLFEGYDKKEMSFSQVEYEKRLVEEFMQSGEEICDNNVDDNKNELTDCLDSLCAGKRCGVGEVDVKIGDETHKEKKELFCIGEICKAPEEIVGQKGVVCGDHACQGNETIENCAKDCSSCPQHEALECAGKVIFKGQDENGCQLEPICMEETKSCQTNEDCLQPLCGIANCVEGQCKLAELSECKEAECVDGDEKVLNCADKTLVSETCVEGVWKKTGVACEGESSQIVQGEQILKQDIVGVECSVREDCGGENDVCSNGKCETIPQVIQTESPTQETILETSQEPPAQETPPETSPENLPTGGIIFSFFRGLLGKITGFQTEGESPPTPPEQLPTQEATQCNPEIEDCSRTSNRCTEETQQCPDGSTVSRNPDNNCAFNQCPQQGQPPQDYSQNPEENTKPKQEDNTKPEKPEGREGGKPEEPQHPPQEKGVFKAGGVCRTSLQKTEAFIFFDGWGDPFEEVRQYKQEFYSGGQADWCKYELENLKAQRKEFENSFNEDFVKWFFEDYLANSAEDWEQSVSGIFELYWKNIDSIMQTARVMQCLELEEMADYTPISRIKYESEFGSLEFWEEFKTARIPGMDKDMKLISPYMKIWIFPNKQFMKYEMKKAMKEHEFPGAPEEKTKMKNEEGLTNEERESIKQNKGFMEKIKNIADKFGGNVNVAVQFKDFATGEIIFNLYVQVNENDVLKMEPMLPEEVPKKDVTIDIDFEKVYDMIYFTEKEMKGAEEQFPPWDKKPFAKGMIKGVINGVQAWLKMRAIFNSAQVSPESVKGDTISLAQELFKMKMEAGGKEEMQINEKGNETENIEGDIFGSKEEITGQIIKG